jgi:transposase
MYRVDMYYTVKTLYEKGFSKRKIARELGLHRDTITSILEKVSHGKMDPEPAQKPSKLDPYKESILEWLEQGKSSVLIHEKLLHHFQVPIAYPTVVKYVRNIRQGEVYIPLISEPGEEAQVDFGYLGLYVKDGKKVKVWCFSMVLSHSRYSYQEVVLDQSVSTFISCHVHAFEYFGGVPQTIKLDNLKAGVISPDFYEPVIQHQYAEFLSHYGSTPITARIRRGQDKGKVESGVKYVKNNFQKRIDHRCYYRLKKDLSHWTDTICNQRLHGTIRKVPARVFEFVEKKALLSLPAGRYEFYQIEKRKASAYAHVSFRYNYYSVPYQYAGYDLVIKSNGSILKVFSGNQKIAVHQICMGQGQYITLEEHKPPYKQKKSREYYLSRMEVIGSFAIDFMETLEKIKPRHWHEMVRGIIHLEKYYQREQINLSCCRALAYGALSYLEVKNILEHKLYDQPQEPSSNDHLGGYAHDLSIYDRINQ